MQEFIDKFFNTSDIMPGFIVILVLMYLGFGFYNLKKHNNWLGKNVFMNIITFFILFFVGVFFLLILCQFAGMGFNFMKSLYLK